MTLLRLLARKSLLPPLSNIRSRLVVHGCYPSLQRHFSYSRALSKPRRDARKVDSRVRQLELSDDGKLTNQTNAEEEVQQLKSRVKELEDEIQKYSTQEGLKSADPNETFGDIFDRMPENLQPKRISREELQAMVDRNDPEMYNYITKDDLVEKEVFEGYDLDKVFQRLPDTMRARLTREDAQSMLDREDSEIMQYLSTEYDVPTSERHDYDVEEVMSRLPAEILQKYSEEELKGMIEQGDPILQEYIEPAEDMVSYDLDKTYAQLPEQMRTTFTLEQVADMMRTQDPAIEEYLVVAEPERSYDLDKTYDALPDDLRARYGKDTVAQMIQEESPIVQEYLVEYEEDSDLGFEASESTQDLEYDVDEVYARLPQDMKQKMTRDKLLKLIENQDPSIQEYLLSPEEQDIEDEIRDDIFGKEDEDVTERDGLHVALPGHSKIHLDAFNRVMKEVVSQSRDPKSIGLLWTKYEACKKNVVGFLGEIPPQVWNILWLSQWKGNPIHESRKQHLWMLVNDMTAVNHDLNHDQKLVYIEYEFSERSRTDAMKIWRKEYSALRADDPVRDEYRDLGVRLHVEAGLLTEAQQLIFGSKRNSPVRAEDVAVVIAAWVQKADEHSLKIAWTLYLDMRERLGPKIKLEDYDQIVMTFLGANKSNLALAVFKDMVISAASRSRDPAAQERTNAIMTQLQSKAVKKEDVDRISLETLATLPKRFENKYFYASWIKRLIGLDEVDATVQVLELMYQRGIRPDARHVNGIIGAWLRGSDKDKHQLSLQIAWSMVRERLNLVHRRRNPSLRITSMTEEPNTKVPSFVSKNLPPATVETFCLLLLYYERRSMNASIDLIKGNLAEAELQPNTFFMNRLIYAELRKQDVGTAWHIFKNMSKTIEPDMETWSALWDCEKIFTSGRSLKAPEFARSRRMFARMTEWYTNLSGRSLQQAKAAFSKSLYNEIIHCFCLQKDLSGTIIALYALRDMFSAYPNPETERQLLIQLARLGEGNVLRTQRRRRAHRFSANTNSVQNFSKVTQLAQLVKDERVDYLLSIGVEDSSLQGNARQEEDLFRIVRLLRLSLRHHAGVDISAESPQEKALSSVAEEMGHAELNPDEPLYSSHAGDSGNVR